MGNALDPDLGPGPAPDPGSDLEADPASGPDLNLGPAPGPDLDLEADPASGSDLEAFCKKIWEAGTKLYRDLPWRNTSDPYAILVSEVMLQQTQVSRVEGRWEEWMEAFPDPAALAAAPMQPVLELWQGMGYNRRALNLKRACEVIVERFDGSVPQDEQDLLSLPGIGPATAAGVRAFAFRLPGVYLETNVRTVFLFELFDGRDGVDDAELRPLIEAVCPRDGSVREWYYALLDYGAYLKKAFPNPSRRSNQHSVQSPFEGSRRQKRAFLLRRVLEGPADAEALACSLSSFEQAAGRDVLDVDDVRKLLYDLRSEGFIELIDGLWMCAE